MSIKTQTTALFITKLIGITVLAGALGWWLGTETAMLIRIFGLPRRRH